MCVYVCVFFVYGVRQVMTCNERLAIDTLLIFVPVCVRKPHIGLYHDV